MARAEHYAVKKPSAAGVLPCEKMVGGGVKNHPHAVRFIDKSSQPQSNDEEDTMGD